MKVNGKKWPRREVAFEFELGWGTKMMGKMEQIEVGAIYIV